MSVITQTVVQKLGGLTEGTITYIEGTTVPISATGFDTVTKFGFSTADCMPDTIIGKIDLTTIGEIDSLALTEDVRNSPAIYSVCLGGETWTKSNWNINVVAAAITAIDGTTSVEVERDVWWRVNITEEVHLSVFYNIKFSRNEDCVTETVIPAVAVEQKDDFYWIQITRLTSDSVAAQYFNQQLWMCLAVTGTTSWRKQSVSIKITSSAFAKVRYPAVLNGTGVAIAKDTISKATNVSVDNISFEEKAVAGSINVNRKVQPLADYVDYIIKFIRLQTDAGKTSTELVAEIYELAKPGNDLYEYFETAGVLQVVTNNGTADNTDPIVFVTALPTTVPPTLTPNTSAPSTLSPSDDSSDNTHLIIIFVCGGVLILAFTAWCCCKKRGKKDAYATAGVAGGQNITSEDGDGPVAEMSNIQAAAEV